MTNIMFITEKAIYAQQRMRKLVTSETAPGFTIKHVASADVAYNNKSAIVASIVYNIMNKKVVEKVTLEEEEKVPYLPGLLGFREGPIMHKAIKKLESGYDAVLVDGHGVVHPRRFGLACHVGVLLDKPTIGVAKSPFIGRIERNEIRDECGALLGRVIEIRDGKKIFVSIGHKISLGDAVQVVRRCIFNGGVEPLRVAHEIAGSLEV